MARGNNFGAGSRDMVKAATFTMKREALAGHVSFKTADDLSNRFSQFADFARSNGVQYAEQITPELVRSWGQSLAESNLAVSTQQNYISAVNSVMTTLTRGNWQSVSPTRDCGVQERTHVRSEPVNTQKSPLDGVVSALRSAGLGRAASVGELAREFGLRSKEASLIDARSALREAQFSSSISVSRGTKGGRLREIPVTQPSQISALERAARVQGNAQSLVSPDKSLAEFRNTDLRALRDELKAVGFSGIHDLRAAYAASRYEALTGHPPPCNGGKITDRELDRSARIQIAAELGHGRIDVVNAYVGGRG